MKQITTFLIDDSLFGLDTAYIRDIPVVAGVTRIPQNTAQLFDKVMRLMDGRLVHLVNTEKLLGIPNKPVSESSRVLVLQSAGVTMGLAVDAVRNLVTVEDDAVMEPLPLSKIRYEFISGIITQGADVIVLLDMGKILTQIGMPKA
ncbi:chemotaxis protein CheW [Desulfovibrio sp. OttesenSCG-928-O18]|nr:chemotaxis protein CheW [Desulfovibrio sp. OttesenSCG-928-O18]